MHQYQSASAHGPSQTVPQKRLPVWHILYRQPLLPRTSFVDFQPAPHPLYSVPLPFRLRCSQQTPPKFLSHFPLSHPSVPQKPIQEAATASSSKTWQWLKAVSSLLGTPLHDLIWSSSQSTKACLSPEWRETAPWGCVPDRAKYEFCSMFKCNTPSQYFQVKPASFFHLLRVIPAEAAPERPKSNFCGGKPAGGARRPLIFPTKAAGETRDGQRLPPPPHRASSFFIPSSRPSTVRGNMGNTRAMAS